MFEQTFKENDITVQFTESEDAAFYALKDGVPYYLASVMTVLKGGEIISEYYREFEREVHPNYFNNYLKKMLEEPDYRIKYLADDSEHWDGKISSTTQNGLNKKCEEAINRINNKKHLNFKDFAGLKTYGRDNFSIAKLDELEKMLSKNCIESIQSSLNDEKDVVAALRWCARGLKTEHAIRKIKTDLEIKNNIAG